MFQDMADFPQIANPSKYSEKNLSFRISKESASGHIMVRGRGTETKKEFGLEWEAISDADKVLLEDHFFSHFGKTFPYTHFKTGSQYTVAYAESDLGFKYLSVGWWKVKVKLRQV